jgi:hypothetical protein
MRRTPPAIVVFAVALLLAVAPGASLPSAGAAEAARAPEVRKLDRRIAEAEHRIRVWDRRIARWQRHVARAAVVVERLQRRADAQATSPTPPDGLTRFTPRHLVLAYQVDQAHDALQASLGDPEARNAQQQAAAWGAFLAELQHARVVLIRHLERAEDATGIVPGEPVTYEAWARGLLSRLDAPACQDNLIIVVTWETAESTEAAFNPLATTHDMDGASDFNSVGVKNYLSLEQGLDASRDTLLGGAESYGYWAIVDSLRACASPEATAAAINASAWCRGCAGGTYITGLLPIVRADYADHALRLISTLAT